MAGGAVTQALQLLFYPVITRLYLPSDFGEFLLYSGVIVVVASIASLKLDAAILAGRKWDVAVLRRLSVLVMIIASLVAGVVLLLVGLIGPSTSISEERQLVLAVLPAGLGLQGLYAIAISKTVREKKYQRLALSQLGISTVSIGVQIAAGMSFHGIGGLLAADISARLAGIALMGLSVRYRGLTVAREGLRYKGIWRRYKQYPKMLAPAAVLNVGSQQLQNILFPLFFGPAQAGQFALANRALGAPISLTSKAIGNVFTGEASAHRNDEVALRELTLHVLRLTTACALPLFVCVACTAPGLFTWIFGENWREAGVYAAILSAGLSASLVVSPLGNLITIRDSLRTGLYFSGAEMFVRAVPFLVGAGMGSSLSAVWMLSIGNVFLYGVGMIRLMHLVGLRFMDYLSNIKNLILLGLLAFAPLVLTATLEVAVGVFVVSLFGGVAIYSAGAFWLWRNE